MSDKILESGHRSEGGSYERLLSQEEEEGHLPTQNPSQSQSRWRQIGIIFLYILALAVVFIIGSTTGYQWRGDRENMDRVCNKHTSQYCKKACVHDITIMS